MGARGGAYGVFDPCVRWGRVSVRSGQVSVRSGQVSVRSGQVSVRSGQVSVRSGHTPPQLNKFQPLRPGEKRQSLFRKQSRTAVTKHFFLQFGYESLPSSDEFLTYETEKGKWVSAHSIRHGESSPSMFLRSGGVR